MDQKIEIISLLENNAKLTAQEIAVQLNADPVSVAKDIAELEDQKIILGYRSIINWDLTEKDSVTAMIEIKITPQRGQGFDRVAQRIYRFPQVKDCFLMSGGFDLMIIIEGKTLKDVAMFVSDKIAPLESVVSTSTHFLLKKYKMQGTIYELPQVEDREAIVL
jgi:DNA-binding Lrp family transcriptional regulator